MTRREAQVRQSELRAVSAQKAKKKLRRKKKTSRRRLHFSYLSSYRLVASIFSVPETQPTSIALFILIVLSRCPLAGI
jgi:hypothetical protein